MFIFRNKKAFSMLTISIMLFSCSDSLQEDSTQAENITFTQDLTPENFSLEVTPDEYGIGFDCIDGSCESVIDKSPIFFQNKDDYIQAKHLKQTALNPYSTLYTQRVENDSSIREFLNNLTQKNPDDKIVYLVSLEEIDFDLRSINTDNEQTRTTIIENRENALKESQENISKIIESLGGTISDRFWITNSLVVISDVMTAQEIAQHPLVKAIHLDDSIILPESTTTADGLFISQATLTREYTDNSWRGQTSGRDTTSNSKIKLGFIDSRVDSRDTSLINYINCNHEAFKENNTSRIKQAKRCGFNTQNNIACTTNLAMCVSTSLSFHGGTHATAVAGIAAANIEHVSNPTEFEIRRSGIAKNAEIYYYAMHNNSGKDLISTTNQGCLVARAIQDLTTVGVDVINMSMTIDNENRTNACKTSYNPCGLNQIIRNASNAGIVFVTSAGNEQKATSSSCNATYPAVHADVLAVGALETTEIQTSLSNPSIALNSYNTTTLAEYSSRGLATGTKVNNSTAFIPSIDIVAPGVVRYFPSTYTSNYFYVGGEPNIGAPGTSYAAPVVSGTIGLIRQWHESMGWSLKNNAGTMRAHIHVFGDGYNGATTPNTKAANYVSPDSGFGRLKAHYPDDINIPHWRSRNANLYPGGQIYWDINNGNPIPTSWTGLKIALHWRTLNFQQIPNINLKVINKCSVIVDEVVREAYTGYYLKKRIMFTHGSQIHGRCLRVVIDGLNISEPHQFWAVSYAYKDPTSRH